MLLLATSFVWYGVAANPIMYVAPESGVTVSGFSYGGDMAVQAHVAFSKTIKGVRNLS